MGRTKKHSKKESEKLEEEVEIHCICDSMDYTTLMICCDYCSVWFHVECVKVTETTAKIIKKFACNFCSDKDPKCMTTYKKGATGVATEQSASTSVTKKDKSGGGEESTEEEKKIKSIEKRKGRDRSTPKQRRFRDDEEEGMGSGELGQKKSKKHKNISAKAEEAKTRGVTGKTHRLDEAQRHHTSDESTVNVHDKWMRRRNKSSGCSRTAVIQQQRLNEILLQRFNVFFENAPNSQTENSEQLQKIQEQMAEININLDELEQWKNNGLTLQNRWDSAACHDKLTLSADRLIVQFIREKGEWRSVLAEQPIPKKGIFYYEVTIVEEQYTIYIGLGTKQQMPLKKFVGFYKGTYGYDSLGKIWGHAVEGCSYYGGSPYIGELPRFGVGDVIGCGVNLATRQIIYTKNGKSLETAGLCVNCGADLFPCVTLVKPGTKVAANFGPNFKFNIADGI